MDSDAVLAARPGTDNEMGETIAPADLVLGGQPTTDDELVDQAILHLRRLYSRGLLSTVVAMGDYLIATFYGGSRQEARSRSPHKAAALGRLLERADELPVTAHALKQSVRIAVQYHELPLSLSDQLSKSQHEALLPLADASKKLELARAAVAQHLTSRALANLVADHDQRTRGGGRPPLPRVARRVGVALRAFEAPGLDDEIDPSALAALAPADLARMREQLLRVRRLLDRIGEALATPGGNKPARVEEEEEETPEEAAPAVEVVEAVEAEEPAEESVGEAYRSLARAVGGRVGEVIAALPWDDAGGEALEAWVVGAMDVLSTPEMAAVLWAVRERVKGLGERAGGYEDRRMRRRVRGLVEAVGGMSEAEARRVRGRLGCG